MDRRNFAKYSLGGVAGDELTVCESQVWLLEVANALSNDILSGVPYIYLLLAIAGRRYASSETHFLAPHQLTRVGCQP